MLQVSWLYVKQHECVMPMCVLLVQVNIRVECSVVKDTLKGQDTTELYLKLLSQEAESYPFKDDD